MTTSANKAILFDYVQERENEIEHISLQQTTRFTKLIYSCLYILDDLLYIRTIAIDIHLHNQHVEMMQVLLDIESFLRSSSTPKLVKDLQNDLLETLMPYRVEAFI